MSCEISRSPDERAEPFPWEAIDLSFRSPSDAPLSPASDPVDDAFVRAAIERDAFARGYAEGERTAALAAHDRVEHLRRRLEQAIVDLRQLRAGILARTERQIVQLTIAIAERIVQREIAVDRMLLVGMARAALDRVGLRATATIRLHPEDYQAISAGAPFAGDAAIRIVADPAVEACGCIVESELGTIDAAPDAQFRELVRALFDDAGVEEASGVANHAVA